MTTATLPARPVATAPFLVVRLADELFGLPGAAVREVTRWHPPTAVPGASNLVLGMISQRGIVLPVVDPRLAFGLATAAPARATRFVIVQHELLTLAVYVDAVADLVEFAVSDVTPAFAEPEPARAWPLGAAMCFDDRLVSLLDPAALVARIQDAG